MRDAAKSNSSFDRTVISGLWSVRARLGSAGRRRLRRVVDPLLADILGSVRSGCDQCLVALTLDDGPDPEVSPRMLDLLSDLGVTATWFLLADRAEQFPTLVKRMVTEGHEVALHGCDHRRLSNVGGRVALEHLRTGRHRLEQVAGVRVRRYRPPYGAQSFTSYLAARAAGLEVVVWSADAQDWVDRNVADVARDACLAVAPGGILLLHERLEPDPPRSFPATSFDRISMVRDVHAGLEARGLRLCSISDLEARGPLVRTLWFRP